MTFARHLFFEVSPVDLEFPNAIVKSRWDWTRTYHSKIFSKAFKQGKGVFSDSNRGFSKQLQLYEKVWGFFATVSTEKGFLQRFSEGFLRRFSE
jgi:hypothetical protein